MNTWLKQGALGVSAVILLWILLIGGVLANSVVKEREEIRAFVSIEAFGTLQEKFQNAPLTLKRPRHLMPWFRVALQVLSKDSRFLLTPPVEKTLALLNWGEEITKESVALFIRSSSQAEWIELSYDYFALRLFMSALRDLTSELRKSHLPDVKDPTLSAEDVIQSWEASRPFWQGIRAVGFELNYLK